MAQWNMVMKVFWAEHAIRVTATALSPLTSTLYRPNACRAFLSDLDAIMRSNT